MNKVLCSARICIMAVWLVWPLGAAPADESVPPPLPSPAAALASPGDKGYKIEKPGTITFTVGVVIKGKVEKPQVVIFLPKEKSYHEEFSFVRSFKNDLLKPMPLAPLEE